MVKQNGLVRVNDDEWYTPRATCDVIAGWLAGAGGLSFDAPLLCPADLLPDGSESHMPQALRNRGFKHVRVTRDLPMDTLFADWQRGEVVVTNPPFTLLVAFRKWLKITGAKHCVLSRPGTLNGWPVIETGGRFKCAKGRGVAAAWMQNIADTSIPIDESKALGNCANCERARCPPNHMTGEWTPGKPRKLYGWCNAVNHGINGCWCMAHTIKGKRTFSRFFHKDGAGL